MMEHFSAGCNDLVSPWWSSAQWRPSWWRWSWRWWPHALPTGPSGWWRAGPVRGAAGEVLDRPVAPIEVAVAASERNAQKCYTLCNRCYRKCYTCVEPLTKTRHAVATPPRQRRITLRYARDASHVTTRAAFCRIGCRERQSALTHSLVSGCTAVAVVAG